MNSKTLVTLTESASHLFRNWKRKLAQSCWAFQMITGLNNAIANKMPK